MTGLMLLAICGWVLAAFGWVAAWGAQDQVDELKRHRARWKRGVA